MTKSIEVSKQEVFDAWLKVKANKGSYGVDKVTIDEFSENLKSNLYKLWNRLGSGSYMPPPVRGVKIPKKSGGKRTLGIPTVLDRIAQTVVKNRLEPHLDPIFHPDSYGYRPNKSALDAVAITRKRCWEFSWIVEFDIKGLFDNIPHDLLMKALRHHTEDRTVLLYTERWLKTPLNENGVEADRVKGTPQGGIISPLLANLFLHYGFDIWMQREWKDLKFCRYADDALVHCKSKEQADQILKSLYTRFKSIGLELHPEKTKIVCCHPRQVKSPEYEVSFVFLGYQFKRRLVRTKYGNLFVSFTPGVSPEAKKAMYKKMRSWQIHKFNNTTIDDIARKLNPTIHGWLNYYGKFQRTALRGVWRILNAHLTKWIRWKYKKLRYNKTRATRCLGRVAKGEPRLFRHWEANYRPATG